MFLQIEKTVTFKNQEIIKKYSSTFVNPVRIKTKVVQLDQVPGTIAPEKKKKRKLQKSKKKIKTCHRRRRHSLFRIQ